MDIRHCEGKPATTGCLGHYDVHRPEWSPDGKYLTFLSKGNASAKSTQVWLPRPDGQLPSCLTRTPKGVVDYRWSPDGAEIAFTTREAGDDEPDPIEVDRRRGRNRLCIVQVSNAKARAVTKPEQHVVEMAWSPDKKEIALVAAPNDGHDEVFEKATLIIVNSQTGSITRTLSKNVGDREGLAWSPDGKTIAFIHFVPKHFAHRLALVPTTGGPCRHPLDHFRATPRQDSHRGRDQA